MKTAAVLLAAACATAPAPSGPKPFSADARVIQGELASDQDFSTLAGHALADRYDAAWAEPALVHLAVRSAQPFTICVPSWASQCSPEQEVPATPGKPVRFWIASAAPTDGSYEVVLDPPPAALHAPLRNDAAGRRERFLRDVPADTRFRAGRLDEHALASFAKDGDAIPARLDAFEALELNVEENRCYRLAIRLAPGAAFSDVAQRGLQMTAALPGEKDLAPHEVGDVSRAGVVVPEFCALQSGVARVGIATKLKTAEQDLGTGAFSIEVWKRPAGPFAETAAARDAAIARETRGYSVARSVSVKLESFHGLEVPLKRGLCYAMVLKLGKGARFSAEARKNRSVDFGLETVDESGSAGPGVVGPGGVAQFHCRQRNEKGRFHLGVQGAELGQGPATLQILTRAIPEAQLRREAAEDRAERADSMRREARRQGESCRACIEEKISCHRRGGSSCYDDFLTCVRSKGYAESTCGG
ncbi:MAG: hypothetical protein ACXWLM_02555 [Myxococcales bacterium]